MYNIDLAQNIYCISFYDSVVVFEKMKRPKPFHIRKGNETIQLFQAPELKKRTIFDKIISKFYRQIDTFNQNKA